MRALPVAHVGLVVLAAFGLSIIVSMALVVQADDAAPRERVIVMNSGRILSGHATRNAGGWLIEQSNGRVQVPENEVKLVADSLRDAYRKQRDAVVEPTPATHVTLARWCISFRLLDEARDELRKCLKIDPDHEEARKLLRRLDDTLNVKPPTPPSGPPVVKNSDGFVVPEVESLGGLSKETATAFTSRIQPLLMNKCGNASCHGSSMREELRLSPVRLGTNGNRMYTERNLAEILRYVDINEPGHSPLLTVPQGAHAGTTSIFFGPQGTEQLKTLRAWVKSVSQEKLKEEQEFAARPSVVAKKKSNARADVAVDSTMSSERLTQEKNAEPQNSRKTAAVAEETSEIPRTLREDQDPSLAEESSDPFDPGVFNRRFFGTSSKTK